VIGICNGFQALVKAGILPGSNEERIKDNSSSATLTFNARGHFECRWITLKPVSQKCIWTRSLTELVTCPVAHGEGNFQVGNSSLLSTLSSRDQIAITYVQADGTSANGFYPANPNGSARDIAGVCNPAGNIFGLMPHPENHIHAWQHPRRARGAEQGSGLPLFRNGVKYAAEF
jgi:phosphoribosylformylglycinamidine synthase